MNNKHQILEKLCNDKLIYKELLEYTKNNFDFSKKIPEKIPDEPFLDIFKNMITDIQKFGITKVLNNNMPHGENNFNFKNPNDISLEIYNSIAGNIPIFYVKNTDDFKELIFKIIYKGKKIPEMKNVGASFVHGKSIRFIILSNKPYSEIPAQSIGLLENEWKNMSMILRREHECTHYFTKRFLLSSKNNILDEIIADFAGIVSASGEYHPDWFLKGMGIDKYPKNQEEGRFSVYTKELSQNAKNVLKEITIKSSYNIKKWSEKEEVKNKSLKEKILFLCSKDLLDFYIM